MKKLSALLLIVATIVPSFLAGHPVYRCQLTDWEGLRCCCDGLQDESAAQSCCSRCDGFGDSADGVDVTLSQIDSHGCSCCDVTTFRVDLTKPIEPQDPEPPVAVMTLTYGDTLLLWSTTERSSSDDEVLTAREGPPLYTLYCHYLR